MDSYGVDKGALSLNGFFVFFFIFIFIKTIKIIEDDLVNFFS
jgi:hypothetical protein